MGGARGHAGASRERLAAHALLCCTGGTCQRACPSYVSLTSPGYLVLTIPAGKYVLTEKLVIKRSRLVLRGAGMGATVLQVPKSE